MSFEFLGLSDTLLKVVAEIGYKEPTPIQRTAIPAVLQGRDILGIAQTGTGKTASFTLPMIDILAEGRARARMPRTLILEPTRELAAQVSEDFEGYGRGHRLTKALLIGGVAFGDQDAALDRGVDVLIATPGRLIDQFERGKVMLTGVEILVIDEADRMLDMGFIPDVEKIRSFIPKKPQTLFFSATMPPEIKRLSDKFLRDPKVIEIAPEAPAAKTVEQSLIILTPREKTRALKTIAQSEEIRNALVFCNRKRDVKMVHRSLKRAGIDAAELHGDMAQSERTEVLASYKAGNIKILVASDVAARGLDMEKVSHVINFDVPQQAEDYVHRIGRTGRAGRSGKSITLAVPDDKKFVAAIERLTGVPIPVVTLAGIAKRDFGAEEKSQQGPAGRDRDSQPSRGGEERRGRRGRRRGGRGRRQPGGEQRPTSQTSPAKQPANAGQRHDHPHDKSEARKPEGGERPAHGQKEPIPAGWGDHMPAFMRERPGKK